MDGQFEFPTPLSGKKEKDIQNLWRDLWKIVERLRLLQEEINAKNGGTDGKDSN